MAFIHHLMPIHPPGLAWPTAGYQAIILTVDSSRFGYREADWRNGFSGLPAGLSLANYPTPDGWDDQRKKGWDQNSEALLDASSTMERDIPWLRSVTKLPIIIKVGVGYSVIGWHVCS